MAPGAQIDYDALASQHGGQASAPPPVDYDSMAASHGGTLSSDNSSSVGSHSLLDAVWDKAWKSTAIGTVGQGADVLADWAKQKVEKNRQENELASSQGKKPPHSETGNTLLDMLSSYGRMEKSASEPKNLVVAGTVMAANTSPFTGVPVDAALAAHGGYNAVKNAPAAIAGDPAAAEAALSSGAEALGGAAGVRAQVPELWTRLSPATAVEEALGRKLTPTEAETPRAGGQIQPALNNTPREVLTHAKAEGISLTPGQATEDAMAQNLQKSGTTAAVGGKDLSNALKENQTKFGQSVNNFMEHVDPARTGVSAEQAGESVQSGVKSAMQTRQGKALNAYNVVRANQGNIFGDLSPLGKFASAKDTEVMAPEAAQSSEFPTPPRQTYQAPAVRAAIDDIQDAPKRVGPDPSIQSMRNLRTEFMDKANDYSGNVPDAARALYKQAAGMVDDQMMLAAKDTPFEQSFRTASSQWKDLQQKFNEPGTPMYKILQQRDPTKIVSQLQNAPANDIATLQQEGIDLSPLRRQVVDDIAKSKFRIAHDGLGGYTDQYLRALFGPDATKELYLKADLANRLNYDPNPSGTGANISSLSQLKLWNQTKMSAAAKMSMPRDPLSFLPDVASSPSRTALPAPLTLPKAAAAPAPSPVSARRSSGGGSSQ